MYREREGKKRREKERERRKRERKRRKTQAQTIDTTRTQTIKCGENHKFAVLIRHLITKLNQIRIELSLVDTDHLCVCANYIRQSPRLDWIKLD